MVWKSLPPCYVKGSRRTQIPLKVSYVDIRSRMWNNMSELCALTSWGMSNSIDECKFHDSKFLLRNDITGHFWKLEETLHRLVPILTPSDQYFGMHGCLNTSKREKLHSGNLLTSGHGLGIEKIGILPLLTLPLPILRMSIYT